MKEDMGTADGVLIFDESGFVKKGNDSIGVGRQYCGSIGKVENSQVGVFAAYASPYGYALLDKRLFIPQKWFLDDYKLRRKKCKLPENIEFKTKPQLAVQMLNNIVEKQIIPFKYVLADSLYGTSPEFIEGTKGPIEYEFTKRRIILSNNDLWIQKKNHAAYLSHRKKRITASMKLH